MSPRGVPTNLPLAIDAEAQMYARASEIAVMAMGKIPYGKHGETKDAAEMDPLAYWCLVELIVKFGGQHASAARKVLYANRRNPE